MEPLISAARYSHRQCFLRIFRCAPIARWRTGLAPGLRTSPARVSRLCWLCWLWDACAAADKVDHWSYEGPVPMKEVHDTTEGPASDRQDRGADPDLQRMRERLADRVPVACGGARGRHPGPGRRLTGRHGGRG